MVGKKTMIVAVGVLGGLASETGQSGGFNIGGWHVDPVGTVGNAITHGDVKTLGLLIVSPPLVIVPGEQLQKVGDDTLKEVKKAGGVTVTELKKASGEVITMTSNAIEDTSHTVTRAGQDAAAMYIKAWKDTAAQTRRSFQDAVDAGQAAAHFEQNQIKGLVHTVDTTAKRLSDGKVVDAMWGAATEPMQASEENFFKATQESSLLNTAASSAAAIYGGPAGAAAYAAWQTYKETGDARLALRVGILAAATSAAGAEVSQMPSRTTSELFKKAAMTGAVGGIAVAAAGGDENAIKDGFLKSGGAVLIQGGQQRLKAYSPNAENAIKTVQCVSARDLDCLSNTTWVRDSKGKALYDRAVQKLDPKQYVGTWSQWPKNSVNAVKQDFIAKISQLPNAKLIPILKSRWVISWTLGSQPELAHGKPSVILTYVGENAPFRSAVAYGIKEKTQPAFNGTVKSANKGTYQCTINAERRRVVVESHSTSCEARYEQKSGTEVVWKSSTNGRVCAEKARAFIVHLKDIGMQCNRS
ncbi:hypothetical protein K788_0000591 [Paraburkholderia caribensis MBA4]|uniref:Uncharacterized protein n=1 Tax=Paraburkholderia caribensis MBA4 TaxID=1323664 RepID=A0A0P0RI61_9BURK|nr:hypothetical protein [Paraburkholderia caribensis]ALL68337.1 hypothetical protein K788_0000591 [Paraburkholderia caribensis MBA4]